MANFATDLANQIVGNEQFLSDFQKVSSYGLLSELKNKALGDAEQSPTPLQIERLLYSASVLAQTDSDHHRSLAQTIVLYSYLATKHPLVIEVATRILSNIGNFPGVSELSKKLGNNRMSFGSVLSNSLLRALNLVDIGSKEFAFTDFQQRVWRRLAEANVTAVTAPTSAGKSFIIVEY